MQLPEIERESILGDRLEEMQRIIDKRAVEQLVKEQNKKGDGDGVSKPAKRNQSLQIVSQIAQLILCRPTCCSWGEEPQTWRIEGKA